MSNRPRRSDAELLSAAARAPEAFGELYDRYAAAAYGWARQDGLRTHASGGTCWIPVA
jgi:hypothetical protein